MIDLHKILVPTDFSKHSQNAIKYATAFAEKFGAELHVLHVVQDLSVFVPDAINITPLVTPPIEQLLTSVRTALDRLVKDHELQKYKVHKVAVEGTPFYEIIRYAKENATDLIIMGTHGHSGLVHVLMGSVAEKVVRKAPCPVLTVRHPEHEFVHP